MNARTGYERRWPLRLLRATAVLVLLDTLAQAALAGLFVTGDLDLLAWHAANAGVLSALTVLEAMAALLVWRRLRGPHWPVVASVVLVALVSAQRGLGEARVLAGHIPLGMAIFGCATALACWAFTNRISISTSTRVAQQAGQPLEMAG
ncbi:hypothetical protein [Streptomyces abikoensis]|uniref:hypothetical protein n=1 Tax=Streptomyces abikoensis TaxID=97398 RepID=UPI001677CC23|nr:hypothetical protein [Streptomyces abikoensis]GGP53121.1 hypothetical protein GCM10010214_27880 [Streptomyces abikoensis]